MTLEEKITKVTSMLPLCKGGIDQTLSHLRDETGAIVESKFVELLAPNTEMKLRSKTDLCVAWCYIMSETLGSMDFKCCFCQGQISAPTFAEYESGIDSFLKRNGIEP